jgi:hypothetical protein
VGGQGGRRPFPAGKARHLPQAVQDAALDPAERLQARRGTKPGFELAPFVRTDGAEKVRREFGRGVRRRAVEQPERFVAFGLPQKHAFLCGPPGHSLSDPNLKGLARRRVPDVEDAKQFVGSRGPRLDPLLLADIEGDREAQNI